MRWARVAAVLGVLLVLASFAVGTEVRPVVALGGVPVRCPAVVRADWLVPGTPAEAMARVPAACGPDRALVRWALGVPLGVGALALLVGWSALREDEYARVAQRPA